MSKTFGSDTWDTPQRQARRTRRHCDGRCQRTQHELLKVGALWTPCSGQLAQGSALAALSALPGLAVTHSDNNDEAMGAA